MSNKSKECTEKVLNMMAKKGPIRGVVVKLPDQTNIKRNNKIADLADDFSRDLSPVDIDKHTAIIQYLFDSLLKECPVLTVQRLAELCYNAADLKGTNPY